MNRIYDNLLSGKQPLSVVGLGYVGMPVAVAFARKTKVIGYDINEDKIAQYRSGIDPTREVGDQVIAQTTVDFTSDPTRLRDAHFHIVAVPTPIRADRSPDLGPLKKASATLGKNLSPNSVVVYESTVYPGATEEVCIPILERESNLKCGVDFKVGYSPERINPGDKVNRLETIIKVVSGMDTDTLDLVAKVYELVVEAGVARASSIKVAEAAKVIENSQRDINIAFMNELSMIFNKMGIDTLSVLEAASTKWNFLNFYPGLVGGHCIGVDPYYLTYKAEQLGYHSQIILSGRRINDGMGKYVVENIIKCLIRADISIKGANVAILGLTFKENCPDIRNTRVIDIVRELADYNITPVVVDPEADSQEALQEYDLSLARLDEIKNMDAIVFAVSHDVFKNLGYEEIEGMYRPGGSPVMIDIKGIMDQEYFERENYIYWRL